MSVPEFVPEALDACEEAPWHTDETKTLQIEINGRRLTKRKCEIQHASRGSIAAVRFAVQVDEVSSLTDEDALTWQFTLREAGKPLGNTTTWRIGGIETGGETCHIWLKPA